MKLKKRLVGVRARVIVNGLSVREVVISLCSVVKYNNLLREKELVGKGGGERGVI